MRIGRGKVLPVVERSSRAVVKYVSGRDTSGGAVLLPRMHCLCEMLAALPMWLDGGL